MLISTKTLKNKMSPGDVASLRLLTGEEIVARVAAIDYDRKNIVVTKPVLIQVHLDDKGQIAGIGFTAFMFSVEESSEYEISFDNLLIMPLPARSDIESNYLRMTTGLALPAKSGLIT